jgi:hypothetical protein
MDAHLLTYVPAVNISRHPRAQFNLRQTSVVQERSLGTQDLDLYGPNPWNLFSYERPIPYVNRKQTVRRVLLEIHYHV